jgi:effector-binding domain-containing protein
LDKSEPCVKEVPPQKVVSRREKGTYQEVIPRLIGDLCGRVMGPEGQKAGVRCSGPPFLICHDKEPKEKDADIEVAVPITGRMKAGPGYEVRTLEGGKVVSYVHKGRYQDVGLAYKRIFEYIGRSGFRPAGPVREMYLNDPKDAPEAELLTEIQVPVVK